MVGRLADGHNQWQINGDFWLGTVDDSTITESGVTSIGGIGTNMLKRGADMVLDGSEAHLVWGTFHSGSLFEFQFFCWPFSEK